MEDTIFGQIRKEADDFYNGFISVVEGYSFNQYKTIKRVLLYTNNKYEDATTYLGRNKIFFNVINAPCEVATKMLNIDTKNIRLWPMNPKSAFSTYLLEKELKLWLKTSKMGRILNQIAEEAPKFGSVVIEKTKDGAQVVDLRRLRLDPSVDSIKDSRFVHTVHYMSPTELRETGWDDVELAIDRFGNVNAAQPYEDESGSMSQQTSTPYIKITKRYGEVPEYMLGGKGEKMVRALFIVAGADDQIRNEEGKSIGEAGVILFKSKWHKEWPYKDFHYTKVKGRWLGVGIPEMLFDVQVRINELKNQKRISMEISSMHLFQTPDRQITRNVLTDKMSGDIIISPNGIQPIANEERNLPAWNTEEEGYAQQVDRLTFAYEAVSGAPLPSSTPATNAVLATNQATSVFAFKRENLALMLQDFFNDLVLPQVLKDLSPEHVMRFTGSINELAKLDEAAAELHVNDTIMKLILNGGRGVSRIEEIATIEKEKALKEYKKQGSQRFLKLKDHFYDDAEFEFDFLIANEQADPSIIANNTQAALIAVSQNPAILNDPRLKVLFYKWAEKIGVSPSELELADQDATQQQQQMMQQAQQMQQVPTQQIPDQAPVAVK